MSLCFLGCCCRQFHSSFAGASRYIHEQNVYSFSKSCYAVREMFSNAYYDREVPKKTTVYLLVTQFRDSGRVYDKQHVRRRAVLTGCTFRRVEEVLIRTTCLILMATCKFAYVIVVIRHYSTLIGFMKYRRLAIHRSTKPNLTFSLLFIAGLIFPPILFMKFQNGLKNGEHLYCTTTLYHNSCPT